MLALLAGVLLGRGALSVIAIYIGRHTRRVNGRVLLRRSAGVLDTISTVFYVLRSDALFTEESVPLSAEIVIFANHAAHFSHSPSNMKVFLASQFIALHARARLRLGGSVDLAQTARLIEPRLRHPIGLHRIHRMHVAEFDLGDVERANDVRPSPSRRPLERAVGQWAEHALSVGC